MARCANCPVSNVRDGPVVVVGVRTDVPVVIERVNSRAVGLDLVDHVTAGTQLSPRLRKRVLTGAKRAKACRRISRAK